MHRPRPHGLLAVGEAPTEDDAAALELLARRLTNLRALSGVESLRMVRSLPDGGYAIAQDMGGVFKVITHKPPPSPPVLFDGLAKASVPMLFSSRITKAIVLPGEGVGMLLTEQTRRRVAGYKPEGLPPKQVSLQRFRVDIGAAFQEFEPKQGSDAKHTQYVQQRPTWYSGAMAEAMQVVGGYGRQDLKELPDTATERAQLKLPEQVAKQVVEQIGNVRLPGYTGFPRQDGQFQYDYKFNNTHGISFDSSGNPWLIRVSPDGVWAMPLPLVPATTTDAFRDYMEQVGDDEILSILNRFGGMPSGESFPVASKDFQAWRRAGVICKVCDVADFYSHIMYASSCGWSFNSRGTEGFNTCYDYDDAEGIGYGLAYKMRLSLGPANFNGNLAPPTKIADPGDASRLDAYISGLFKRLGSDAESLAIKYKLRRIDQSQILERSGQEPNQQEVDYWNNLELPPIAVHSGNVAEVGRGWLYHGASFRFQPQIKFPEPFMQGCVSHDFLPLIEGRHKSKYPKSDTIMFGYYVGSTLKVVKYFRDDGTFQRDVESDYDECMQVGSWTKTETTGLTSLVGNFYLTDIDERKTLAPQTTVTRIVGKDLGYDSQPFFSFDNFFWKPGTLWRNRYYSHKTNVEQTEGHGFAVAVCIPYFMRNAALHAENESVTGKSKSEGTSLGSTQDPTSYRYWTYDFIWAWAGGLPVMRGSPYPKNGNPVWVEIEEYNPGPCTNFADGGPWIKGLPANYTWLVHPNQGGWQHSGGGGPPSFKPYGTSSVEGSSESGKLRMSIFDEPSLVHVRVPDRMYFLGSPDEYVGIFYRDACKVVMGDSEYANVSEVETPGDERRKHWGFTSLADHKGAHHFTGVIHE